MKKILIVIVCSGLLFNLTGCGNKSERTESNKVNETSKETSSQEEKIVVCTQPDQFYPKMESVYLKGNKLEKIINSHTTIVSSKKYLDIYCEQKKGDYNKLNNIKGTSAIINCDGEKMSVYDEETYIVNEIEDFDSFTGFAIPSQFGGAYFDEDSHEFNLSFWLEGKNTQGYTCEEKYEEN